ncbi:hypothetical protein IWQ57_001742 [Coemansia nantahalensis]|uniref:Uncharacterized protein n=2 Tax=Coemansia TaxID=4863 RepID=A0ACC1K2V5_9FUNG|nr:hypothetical protein IWQ57_001742 [Coemansia nantahalensis]
MDISDIFREVVTGAPRGGSQSRRRVGAAPSLRELKEGGYGIVDSNRAAASAGGAAESRDGDEGESSDGDGEGGRFFADGLTVAEKGVLEWVDHMEDMDAALDRTAVQRLVGQLERAVSRNTEDRIAHAQAPERFAESEAELDEAIQRLLVLANDVQHLAVLDEVGAVPTLVGLVAHENADIALDVIQLVVELTAEDAWSQEGESQEERAAVVGFVSRMAQSELFEMLGQNLRRLDEGAASSEGDADRQGVFQTLALVENLVSLDVSLAERAVTAMDLLRWLERRVCTSYAADGAQTDANRQYAAEVTSILLQASPAVRLEAGSGLMDALLRCLAKYRKHTPDDEIEMEYLENIVDSVCMLATTPAGKRAFVECEGVELLVLLQKQPQVCRLLSLKILDYALSPPPPPPSQQPPPQPGGSVDAADTNREPHAIARRYIDNMGLKYLFAILMHRGGPAVKKLHKRYPETDERAVSCIAWLLRLTERGSPPHWRVLAKFVPSAADSLSWKPHVDRIVELNAAWAERVRDADDQFARRANDDDYDDNGAEERYLARMDSGLFALQMADIVVAFVAQEQQPAVRIEQQLRRKGRSMAAVQSELTEYISTRAAGTLGAGSTNAVASADSGLSGILERL